MTKLDSARKKGIYLLPNLFTTGALFSGYYAIVAAIGEKYEMACLSIFIAALLDTLDGRVARLTNTQSEFGEQYDSLSDLVSFGIAPSILIFHWSLMYLGEIHPIMGKIGWLAAFIYAVSAALRLARFNTQIGTLDKAYFQGLPSPAAAAVIASFVWVCSDLGLVGRDLRFVALPLTIITGLLLVSRLRYYSFKTINFKENVSFIWILALVLVFVLLSIKTQWVLFVTFSAYAISGIVMTLRSVHKKRQKKRQPKSPPQSSPQASPQSAGKAAARSKSKNKTKTKATTKTTAKKATKKTGAQKETPKNAE